MLIRGGGSLEGCGAFRELGARMMNRGARRMKVCAGKMKRGAGSLNGDGPKLNKGAGMLEVPGGNSSLAGQG